MNITMNNAIEEYYKYSKLHLKKTTFEEQKRKVDKYILNYFKNNNIYEIGIKDIISWKEYIEKLNFSYNYKSYLYYSLTSIFNFFMKYYDLNKNYAKLEGNFRNNDIKKIGNIWTIEEFNTFLSVIKDEKYKVLFKLLFYSGLRKGELLGLTWNDICFTNNIIIVNKTITRNHELQKPKTDSSTRLISINKSIISDLKKIKKFDDKENDLIFNISFTQLKRKKDYYCNLAGVKQIKIHEFRHSHSIFLYQNKVPIEDIQHRLGHSDMSITMDTYLKYLPRNEKRVIKLLNSF